jgi:hypothetical protein
MDARPSLAISFAPNFSVTIQFSGVQRYELVGPEYRFNFSCRVLHSKGEFTYVGRDICFDLQTFREFVEQLDAIRTGKAVSARFHEVGDMIEFSVEICERKAQASLAIREYQPNDEQTRFSASFQVDYDLFVNALHSKVTEFIEEVENATSF